MVYTPGFEEGIEAEIYGHFPPFLVWIGRVLSASSLHTHIGTVYRLEWGMMSVLTEEKAATFLIPSS